MTTPPGTRAVRVRTERASPRANGVRRGGGRRRVHRYAGHRGASHQVRRDTTREGGRGPRADPVCGRDIGRRGQGQTHGAHGADEGCDEAALHDRRIGESVRPLPQLAYMAGRGCGVSGEPSAELVTSGGSGHVVSCGRLLVLRIDAAPCPDQAEATAGSGWRAVRRARAGRGSCAAGRVGCRWASTRAARLGRWTSRR